MHIQDLPRTKISHLGDEQSPALDGFLTFVHVKEGESTPHGFDVERPTGGDPLRLWNTVEKLREEQRSVQED